MFDRIREQFVQMVYANSGEPVETRYADCGDVRFVAPYQFGRRSRYVLLYAVMLDDGLYEIGSASESRFDKGETEFTVYCAKLDHVPADGEVVEEWIRFAGDGDLDIAYSRAARYLRDNGFKKCYIRLPCRKLQPWEQ